MYAEDVCDEINGMPTRLVLFEEEDEECVDSKCCEESGAGDMEGCGENYHPGQERERRKGHHGGLSV